MPFLIMGCKSGGNGISKYSLVTLYCKICKTKIILHYIDIVNRGDDVLICEKCIKLLKEKDDKKI